MKESLEGLHVLPPHTPPPHPRSFFSCPFNFRSSGPVAASQVELKIKNKKGSVHFWLFPQITPPAPCPPLHIRRKYQVGVGGTLSPLIFHIKYPVSIYNEYIILNYTWFI